MQMRFTLDLTQLTSRGTQIAARSTLRPGIILAVTLQNGDMAEIPLSSELQSSILEKLLSFAKALTLELHSSLLGVVTPEGNDPVAFAIHASSDTTPSTRIM